jgi:hypothetical protein
MENTELCLTFLAQFKDIGKRLICNLKMEDQETASSDISWDYCGISFNSF